MKRFGHITLLILITFNYFLWCFQFSKNHIDRSLCVLLNFLNTTDQWQIQARCLLLRKKASKVLHFLKGMLSGDALLGVVQLH